MNVSPAASTNDTPSDRSIAKADLIAQACRGQESAWGDLMPRHQETAFRLAYLMLGDAAEAEDVAQEAFIRAYMKLETFDSQRPFRPWILSITANLARNHKRGLGRYWHALRRWQNEKEALNPDSNPVARQTEVELLWQAVARLKPKGQEVVYLRYFFGSVRIGNGRNAGHPLRNGQITAKPGAASVAGHHPAGFSGVGRDLSLKAPDEKCFWYDR